MASKSGLFSLYLESLFVIWCFYSLTILLIFMEKTPKIMEYHKVMELNAIGESTQKCLACD